MEEKAPVFVDAGPLIILGRAGYLHLLRDLFGRVFVTSVVRAEVLPGENRPAEVAIARAMAEGYIVKLGLDPPAIAGLPANVDAGEKSIIEAGAYIPDSLLVLDDLVARSCAEKLGLEVTGVIGLLLLAKQEGLVPLVGIALERVLAAGLYVSPELITHVAAKAGETLSPGLAEAIRRKR